jgi:hypothetical protein
MNENTSIDDFINAAIDKGQSVGLTDLNSVERLVYFISEAEASCDIDGIDSLLDEYSAAEIAEGAAAFREIGAIEIADALQIIVAALPDRDETAMSSADTLIKERTGYDYDAIRAAVARRLNL